MRVLRFLIAAACGVMVTVLAIEHRDAAEQLFTKTVAAMERRPVASFDKSVDDPDIAPIEIVPIAAKSAAAVAPVTGVQPRWHIVDASLETAPHASGVPVTTVSDTKSSATIIAAATKAKPASNANSSVPKWEILGQSANDRPIHVRKAGSGSDITLVVAGMDGEDRIAVKWVDQLSQRIDEAPELVADRQLILLRAVNPDGLTVKQTTNGRGVVINRNFPTASYQPGGEDANAGSGPASEPETRAVLKLLAELRPQRIIHVQSSNKTAAFSNAKSAAVVQSWQQALHTKPQSLDMRHHPGSLEEYAATVLGLNVISLQLPTGDDWRAAGLTHVPTLLAMSAPIADQNLDTNEIIALKDPATDHSLEPSPFHESSAAEVDDVAPRPQRKGYEELPPPPFKPNW